MANSREHFALDWIKGELLETLNGARQALEAYVESDRDETRMRACLTALHQVHGTLVMLELEGVTLLADHLEQLAQRMLSGDVEDEAGASQVLMQGMLELPGHLDEIQSGAEDTVKSVATLVNDLRGHLGQEPLAGGGSSPIAMEAPESALSRFEDIDGAGKTRKIRAAYQQVLLSILRGEDVAGSADMLFKVAQSLQRVCQGTPHELQWQAFGEFVASLGTHQGPLDGASVKLLRRVDSEIRILAQNGIDSLKAPFSPELMELLLEAAEARGHQSAGIDRLRSELEGSPDEDEGVSPAGRQALSSAARALREELLLVKDQLDLIVRSKAPSGGQLAGLVAPLKQIGSTLSLLGFESSKTIVADQVETLDRFAEGEPAEQADLMSIASALVQVDENLASFSQGGKNEVERIVDEAHKAVMVEARQGLDGVKQDIVDFISSQWDVRHLEETPARIRAICGALDIIPLARASRLLANCSSYVATTLTDGHTPTWQEMDHFADAVSGLDYYLERVGDESSFGVEDVLDLVEHSLEGLRVEPGAGPAASAPTAETPAVEELKVEEVAGEAAAEEPVAEEPAGESVTALEPEASETAAEAPDARDEIAGLPAEEPEQTVAAEEPSAVSGEARAEEPVLTGDDEPLATLPGDIQDEEEEPALEMDDDPGFDLAGAGFAEFDESGEAAPESQEAADMEAAAGSELEEAAIEAGEPADEPVEEPDEAPIAASVSASASARVDPSLKDNFESDAEIVEIFVEEVDEVLEAVDEWLPVWRADLENEDALTEVRRAFHTLKGSGRIVGANVIGEVAWSVENMLNRLIDGTVPANVQFVTVVEQARALVPRLKEAFETKDAPDMAPVGGIMEMADILASGGSLDEAEVEDGPKPAPAETVDADLSDEESAADSALRIFVGEARQHLATLEDAVVSAGDGESALTLDENTLRALHTLAGSAGMAEFTTIEALARPVYELASATRGTEDRAATGAVGDFLIRGMRALTAAVDAVEEHGEAENLQALITEAEGLIAAAAETPAGAGWAALMELPGITHILAADEFLESWRDGAMDLAEGDALMAALAEMGQVAAEHEIPPIAALARSFAAALERLAHDALDADGSRVLMEAHQQLLALFDALAAEQQFADVSGIVARLDDLTEGKTDAGSEEETFELIEEADDQPPEPEPGNVVAFPSDSREDDVSLEELETSLLDETRVPMDSGGEDTEVVQAPVETIQEVDEVLGLDIAASAVPAAVAELLPEEVDDEIIEVFFEEADEILEGLEENIHRWSSEPDNRLFLEHMLRGLHTLKGGARLSGLTKLGDATHQFESFLIDVQSGSGVQDVGFFDDLHARYDGVTNLLAVIRKALAGESVAVPESAGEPAGAEPEPEVTAGSTGGSGAPPADTTSAEQTQPKPFEPSVQPAREAESEPAPETRGGQEIVRVGSGLLEDLVNLAGESSIVRARVEQGMSDFTGALEEMETTIERLREQLRRLEIETESQILFRQDRPDGPAYTNFDPLEMDRYSQLQQLSRGLSESASDMLDLKETLLFKARESETLLLQQARINTELQEGLMRTRMVPFSRLLPRLRRIVRQVSSELGKEVEFHAYNAEGELDRSLLERMVPPLEHMLRNAVDHGIESPELRANFGKPGTGRIDLRLSREGGDVVIEISDDGAGIDVESVRAKAVERGLMSADTRLTDEEISQFVLAPGFSTAKSVTQISGRGVGMDVVHSEVKQLGGSIQIGSRPGKGTRFVVRVPFTVSVNRALMVSVGDDFYAVPLNNIEGIVLLSPEELERLYAPDGNTFEYAGIPYRVRYLGHYLGREFRSSNQQSSVPVVLVRSGDHAVAVHVDGVQGSREIVVKSLGPQFAGVGGISGATILGDGSVVVILDLLALIRAHGGQGLISGKRTLAGAARTRCVMVVDDSVTVRKVTSRLLERQGMDVLVAKDGVEAVAMLQERRPDVMLLDIEMPRMDGFEVARQVRHDERLADLPIVMISSRTGEKHQEHAAELGVDSFLGKPFQENELLETIDRLVD